MKKIFFASLLVISAIFLNSLNQKTFAIPNPWVDCGEDMECAVQKAGFEFPIKVKNPNIRAMEDLIEITFPLDKKRTVCIRKSQTYSGDNSGVYINYPINKTISRDNVLFNVRGDKKNFYVVTFATKSGYYSMYSEEGMKQKDIKRLYNLIYKTEQK